MTKIFILLISLWWILPAYGQEDPEQSPQSGGAGVHRILVIPVNLFGHKPVELDHAQVLQALFGAENSVASRYKSISYGQLTFTGSDSDIVDPIMLTQPEDFCNKGFGHLADEADQELQSRGMDLSAYNHLVYVLPKDAPCWWTGLSIIGGHRVWVKATTALVLEHELGHNLGMNHAAKWQNPSAEGSDFMGSGKTSLNAPHVVEMGWLQGFPGKVLEIKQSGDVTLAALDSDPRQSVLPWVVIIRPSDSGHTYYLSYRASNLANPLPEKFIKGLNIHIYDGPARWSGDRTYFVKSLSDGETYSDGPMMVQQQSHIVGAQVTFHISFSGTGSAMPAGPPPARPGTIQSIATGKCLDLPGANTDDGTFIIQYSCHGGSNQQWHVDPVNDSANRIVSKKSGKCLGTDPSTNVEGGNIVQLPCDNGSNQLWTLQDVPGGYVFQNVANRLCLDVPGGSTTDGTKLVSWACHGSLNQSWRYTPRDVL